MATDPLPNPLPTRLNGLEGGVVFDNFRSRESRRLLLALFIGVFMSALDTAVVAPAIPALREAFAVDNRLIGMMTVAFVLASMPSTVLMAYLGDRIGRRTIYLSCVITFALGSALIALSPGYATLIVGRVIQGVGAGGLMPVASAVIGDAFVPDIRGKVLGLVGATYGMAFVVGPPLAGLLMVVAGWRWIFLLNLPVAAGVVILARRALPGRAPSPGAGGFDALGIVVLIALLSALVLGMTGLIDNWTGLRLAPGLLALTIPLGWVFVAVERRAQRPMVPLSLFARRRLALSYLLSCGAGFGMGAVAFLTSVTQLTHGVAVRHGGFALLPLVLCSMAGSVVAGRRLNQIGPRPLIVVGFALLTLGYIGIATGTFGLPGFLMYSAAVGLGVGVVVSGALRTIALEDAPAAQRGAAQGLVNLSSSVGTLVSAAAIGALADFNGGGARGFEVAYLVVGLAMVAMILIGLALPERSPPAHDDRDPLLGTPVPEASRGQ